MSNSSSVTDRIDSVLKKVWKKEIIDDYKNDFLFKEDTLKNNVTNLRDIDIIWAL